MLCNYIVLECKKRCLLFQETEEALEELRAKLRDTKASMDNEVDGLNMQVTALLLSQ